MKLLYCILLAALPSILFAQTNYHAGYILKNNGDTVKGYIDYREWSQSPTSIDFRASKSDKQTQQFSPVNIKGFEIDNMETYISYSGLISNDRNHFPDLAERLDTARLQADIFLKLITSGSHLSLYSQTDERKTRYFVAEGNDRPIELKYNQYYNELHEVVERPFFRGQLIFYINKYTPGNTRLIGQAGEVSFEDDPLERIIYKINGDTAVKINGRAKQSNFRGFIGVGLSYAQTKSEIITGSSLSAFPQFIMGFDKFDNPNVQQLIIRASLSVSPVSAKVNYPLLGSPDNILKFDQFTIAVTPQIIYNIFNKDNFKVYIGAGAGLNFSSYSNEEFSSPATTGQDYGDPNLIHFSSFWVSIPLQTGVMINKRWEISFTYAPYSKISPNSNNRVSDQTFGLGIKVFIAGK